MAEPVTAVVAASKLARGRQERMPRLLTRVVGPPADELGKALKRWMKLRTQNVGRIVESADRKLGDRAALPGAVPLRVAARILEEGSYIDDRVMGEYLGGVLASSRSESGRDDRGAKWISLITDLSAYEIRLHYLLYTTARALYIRRGVSVEWSNEGTYGPHLAAVLLGSQIELGMDFSETEIAHKIIGEALFSLARESLIGQDFAFATKDHLAQVRLMGGQRILPEGEGVALVYSVRPVGIQLFMWAAGVGSEWIRFTDPDLELPAIDFPSCFALAPEELPPNSQPG